MPIRHTPFIIEQVESRTMATIKALCTEKTPFQVEQINGEYLPALRDILRIRNTLEEQHRLAGSLWTVFSKIIQSSPSGTEFDLDVFLPAFCQSLRTRTKEPSLAEGALATAVHLAECVGFSFSVIAPSLIEMIIHASEEEIPAELRWRTLKHLNKALSVSSLLHEHMPQFFTAAMEILNKKSKEGEVQKNHCANRELFGLLASIVRTSASLIKPSLLVDLQRNVCLATLSPPNQAADIGVLELLNALLENNHEGIPVPIQVARTVFWRNYGRQSAEYREEVLKGRNLCQLYIRPKRIIHDVAIKKQAENEDNPIVDDSPMKQQQSSTFPEPAESSDSDSIIPLDTDDEDKDEENLATAKEAEQQNPKLGKPLNKKNLDKAPKTSKEKADSDTGDFEQTADEMLLDFIID